MNCSRASIDPSGIDPNASGVLRRFPLLEHSWFQVRWCIKRSLIRISAARIPVKHRRFRKSAQNARRRVNQHDAGSGGIDTAELGFQRGANSTAALLSVNTSWAGANQDKGQKILVRSDLLLLPIVQTLATPYCGCEARPPVLSSRARTLRIHRGQSNCA